MGRRRRGLPSPRPALEGVGIGPAWSRIRCRNFVFIVCPGPISRGLSSCQGPVAMEDSQSLPARAGSAQCHHCTSGKSQVDQSVPTWMREAPERFYLRVPARSNTLLARASPRAMTPLPPVGGAAASARERSPDRIQERGLRTVARATLMTSMRRNVDLSMFMFQPPWKTVPAVGATGMQSPQAVPSGPRPDSVAWCWWAGQESLGAPRRGYMDDSRILEVSGEVPPQASCSAEVTAATSRRQCWADGLRSLFSSARSLRFHS